MEAEKILASVDDKKLISLLQTMVQHKSVSGQEGELGKYLLNYLQAMGMEARLQEVRPNRFNVIAVLKGTGGGESVLYNGHIDTNPVGLNWTVDPYEGKVDDEFIYGIGVSNMKSSDAAFIHAVDSIIRSGVRVKGDIQISLVIGELEGGIGTLKLLAEGIQADWFINGEPTDLSLLTLHAGSFIVSINVFGVSYHMSKAECGVNAIAKAMRVVEAVQNMKFSHAARPEYAGLNRVNVGAIHGGLGTTYNDTRVPQIPDYCTVKVAFRYAPSQSIATVMKDLQDTLDRIAREDKDFKAEIVPLRTEPGMGPFEIDQNARVVQVIRKNHQFITGEEPRIGDVAPYKFYGTDAGHLSRYGLNGVVYGSGGKYNTMPDERVELKDIKAIARVYALSILDLCNKEK